MLLLISDANILMDIELGDLVAPMFSLGYQFAVPNVLYYEELEEQHAHLLDLGLQVRTMSAKSVERVQALSQTYAKPSRNDLFVLALAEAEKCWMNSKLPSPQTRNRIDSGVLASPNPLNFHQELAMAYGNPPLGPQPCVA